MTSEDHEEIKSGIVSGMRMMLQKMSEVSRQKTNWTLCEMGQMTDMLKDVSSAYKNFAKAQHFLSEHSSETY